MRQELEQHLILEAEVVFPLIKEYEQLDENLQTNN